MIDTSKEQTRPLGSHDLFILGEDGCYYHLDNQLLGKAKRWHDEIELSMECAKTSAWLLALKQYGSVLAIHTDSEKMEETAFRDDVDAVLCVMLNYRSISQSFNEVAKNAFKLGRKAGRQEKA